MLNCSICKHEVKGQQIAVKEMMFGRDEYFNYRECQHCGTLLLETIPENLGAYYPSDYYSFANEQALPQFSPVKRALIRLRDLNFYKVKKNLVGSFLQLFYPLKGTEIQYRGYQFAYKIWNKNPNMKMLDLGSGAGNIVRYMRSMGCAGLSGIDPFIAQTTSHKGFSLISKADIFSWEEPLDAVMMNHSFEHMPDPRGVIERIAQVLKPGGELMIRLPVRGAGYEHYRENWLCFDAPRHLFLTTEKGMRNLIEGTGLVLERIEYETPDYYALGSELIKKGYSFTRMNETESLLSAEEIQAAKALTKKMNAAEEGDAAAYYLRKK